MLSSPGMSAAFAGGPAAPTLVERVGRLARVRAWWLTAALWGAFALLAAVIVQTQLAWAWAPPWPRWASGVCWRLTASRLAWAPLPCR